MEKQELPNDMDYLKTLLMKQYEENRLLQEKIDNLLVHVAQLQQWIFGKKSEKRLNPIARGFPAKSW